MSLLLTIRQRMDGWTVDESVEGLLLIRYRGGPPFLLNRRDTGSETFEAVQAVLKAQMDSWKNERWPLWLFALLVVLVLMSASWWADRLFDLLRLIGG